jgi:hypothetical protein
VRLLQGSSEYGIGRGLIRRSFRNHAGGSNFLRGKPILPASSAVMRLLSIKSCYSEESRAKVARTDAIFNKFYLKNHLKIKNKHNPENFKIRIYTMKLSAGLPNLVRLSL